MKEMVFGIVGGLGLFLFGTGLLSDDLKKVAGQKLKNLLESLTKHRVIAVLIGALTTCLIQSSSATTVMTVGFVNAGLLSEVDELRKEVDKMFDRIIPALEKEDIEAAKSALVNEDNLNKMQIDFRRMHVERMGESICSPQVGPIFVDLVDNVEKIGDHLTNIAQAVIGGLRWAEAEPKTYRES